GLALGTIRGSRSWVGLTLLALATVCSFLVAIFPGTLQYSTNLLIHSLSAFVGFSSLGIAALVWSQRFRKDTDWRSSALASLVLGLLMLLSLVSMVVGPPDLLGLTERILEVFIIFWLCFMAWRLAILVPKQSLSPA
ncbi:MAG TPA: DUF998 domain-containing protein, partial [Ktedonobacteraceae bacterium]